MAKGWTNRWNHRDKGPRPSHIEALDVKENTSLTDTGWKLPPFEEPFDSNDAFVCIKPE